MSIKALIKLCEKLSDKYSQNYMDSGKTPWTYPSYSIKTFSQDDIKRLQQLIGTKSDGIWGPDSIASLKQFEQSKGWEVSDPGEILQDNFNKMNIHSVQLPSKTDNKTNSSISEYQSYLLELANKSNMKLEFTPIINGIWTSDWQDLAKKVMGNLGIAK